QREEQRKAACDPAAEGCGNGEVGRPARLWLVQGVSEVRGGPAIIGRSDPRTPSRDGAVHSIQDTSGQLDRRAWACAADASLWISSNDAARHSSGSMARVGNRQAASLTTVTCGTKEGTAGIRIPLPCSTSSRAAWSAANGGGGSAQPSHHGMDRFLKLPAWSSLKLNGAACKPCTAPRSASSKVRSSARKPPRKRRVMWYRAGSTRRPAPGAVATRRAATCAIRPDSDSPGTRAKNSRWGPRSCIGLRPYPECKADPGADLPPGLGHRVLVGQLRTVAHHQQAAGLELHLQGTARRCVRAYRHPPRGAKRKQHHRMAGHQHVQLVAVRCDTVIAVPVQVQANGVERCIHHVAHRP